MLTLHSHYPQRCLSLGKVIDKAGSSQVTIFADHVAKVAYPSGHTGPVLKELYTALLARPIRFLATPIGNCRFTPKGFLHVKLTPVGFFGRPTADQLKEFVRCILSALCALHHIGWVHRDVRVNNVMRVPGVGWYLMDLEWANKVDQSMDHYNPQREFLPPELRDVDPTAIWTTAADMWQFGEVLQQCLPFGREDGDLAELRALVTRLRDTEPLNRPSAREILVWLRAN